MTAVLIDPNPPSVTDDPLAYRLPESLHFWAKRQKLDIHVIHSSGGELAPARAAYLTP